MNQSKNKSSSPDGILHQVSDWVLLVVLFLFLPHIAFTEWKSFTLNSLIEWGFCSAFSDEFAKVSMMKIIKKTLCKLLFQGNEQFYVSTGHIGNWIVQYSCTYESLSYVDSQSTTADTDMNHSPSSQSLRMFICF